MTGIRIKPLVFIVEVFDDDINTPQDLIDRIDAENFKILNFSVGLITMTPRQ